MSDATVGVWKKLIWNRMTASILKQVPNTNRLKQTRTHSMQIFDEIPFVKPQNNT